MTEREGTRNLPDMKRALLLVFLLATSLLAQGQAITFNHVTVINPATSSVQPNQSVTITGDKITSVSPAKTTQQPKNARVIDATGQFLIPGLWDMHIHSAF